MSFIKQGVVLPLGSSGDFDDMRVYSPAPLLLDGRVYLYYASHDGSTYRAGLAIGEEAL